MSSDNIIRAWKDEAYRDSLSEKDRELMPQNPAGIIELSDKQMESASGGTLSTLLSCLPWCVSTLVGPKSCFDY